MAKSPYDIAPGATFPEAAHTAIERQLELLLANVDGTRTGDDIEALHDMRVASRRLRAALSVFGDVFTPKKFEPLEKQVARVTDALGAVRDADVLIEFMQAARDQAPESQRVGLNAFLRHLQQERDAERIHLVKALDRLEKSSFQQDFQALLGHGTTIGSSDNG